MKALLSSSTLSLLNEVVKPIGYDKEQASNGIVHIGIGAFHRAHQAVFTNDLLKLDNHWKITAVSLRSPKIRNEMSPQNSLYTVVERSNTGDEVSLIGAVENVLVAPENPQSVIDAIANQETKVVTLTITEKGYCRDASGEHIDVNSQIVKDDLLTPHSPKTFAGFIVAACNLRRKSGDKLTIISCDNLPSNGRITQTIVLEFANLLDPELAHWIKDNVSFCNSMVDRIVPATTADDIAQVSELIGVIDNCTVITEPFKQWVIEDDFVNEKPAWDSVGAMFVKNIEVFEEMKLRLLNGAHSCLAYVGFMKGHKFIHQAVNDDICLALTKALHKDLLSTLDNVPSIDLAVYAQTILSRFANEKVLYKTSQVACDGSQKLPQRLFKPALELLETGHVSKSIALVIAVWIKFLMEKDHQGASFTVIDPIADKLRKLVKKYQNTPVDQIKAILTLCSTTGELLASSDVFISQVVKSLEVLNNGTIDDAIECALRHG